MMLGRLRFGDCGLGGLDDRMIESSLARGWELCRAARGVNFFF